MVHSYSKDNDNGTMLRIEPVRIGRDSLEYECLAENGVGDAVSATAVLTVYERKFFSIFFCSTRVFLELIFGYKKTIYLNSTLKT